MTTFQPKRNAAGPPPAPASPDALEPILDGPANQATPGARVALGTDLGHPSPSRAQNAGAQLPTLLAPAAGAPMAVSRSTGGIMAQLGANSDGPRLRLVAGRMIPGTRYRIVRWLGEGGMGVVYEVENIDIEKNFALKVLRFDLSQQEHIAHIFREEARAASRIGSPYIVDISNFGELADGRLFFCMEMLDGRDLTPDPSDPIVSLPEFLSQLRQICKGLGAAHDAGIVHRDIKPENIFVYQHDGKERVKLLDFGIAAMGGESASGGTPHYMPPEQILAMEFDGRLDIYALGCTAYELLTGETPFESEDVEQLFAMHLENPVRPFSEVNPDHQVPPAIEAVIMRCLEKHPKDRYANMAELEAALCEAQIEADIVTPWDDLPLPDIDPERRASLAKRMPSAYRYRGRRRWMWPAIAAVSTAVAAGLAFALSERPATDAELDHIESLVARAQNAGARTWYVYPPDNDPKAETSYLAVLELEKLDGSMGSAAKDKAQELRKQFAQTLNTVGDRYWEVPGARGFARDFYTQAVFFDPNSKVANKRSGVTPGQLTELKQRAAKRKFNADMLASFQILNAMAEPNVKRRAAKLKRRQRNAKKTASGTNFLAEAINVSTKVKALPQAPELSKHHTVLTRKQLSAIAAKEELIHPATAPAASAKPVQAPKAAAPAEPRPVEPNPRKAKPRRGEKAAAKRRKPDQAPSKNDVARSLAYLTKAHAERRRGKRRAAERLYNLALAHNPVNHQALNALSELYFDMGRYEKSVKNAASAVRLAPNNAGYALQHGDALYKVRRYLQARASYQKAQGLGSSKAKSRLSTLQKKIGNR